MHHRTDRVAGILLAAVMICQPIASLPSLHISAFEAGMTLESFAEAVRTMTAQDTPDTYYDELIYDKAADVLYCDEVPVGDAYGEIVVEHGELYVSDGTLPMRAAKSEPLRQPLAACAAESGYTYTETADTITITNEFQTARLIVKAAGEIDSYGALEVAEGYRDLHILQYATSAEAYAAYVRYQSNRAVEYVQPSHIVSLEDPAASSLCAETALATDHNYNTWGEQYLGTKAFIQAYLENEMQSEVIVAVVDTGINRRQTLFAGRLTEEEVNFSNSGDDTADDDYGHGTHCSGTICELTPNNVKLLPIKVFDQDGNGTDEQIYLGLMYAIEYGADIVNMSFGGLGVSPLEVEAMSIAEECGLTCVAAAGNNGDDAAYYYPGGIASCITVAAADRDLTLASFSNHGSMIDVAAPGVGIVSTVLGENGETEAWDGTSMATPHVSACCALLKLTRPDLTPAQIQALLQANALDIGVEGFDTEFGWGMVSLQDFDWCEGICHAPVFSMQGGKYGNAIVTQLTCPTSDAEIYYTTDGSTPSATNGTLYTEPISVTNSMQVRAVACRTGCESSIVTEVAYLICGEDVPDAFETADGTILRYRGILATPTLPQTDAAGKPITAIADDAFAGNRYLQTITLPDTVTEIGAGAFAGCTALQRCDAANVMQIGARAFADCTQLAQLSEMPNLQFVGEGAFAHCAALQALSLSAVSALPDQVCIGCTALEFVSMPYVTEIGEKAFAGCIALKRMECPWDAVTAIAAAAFSGCSALRGELSLTALTTLGAEAFADASALQGVLLSEQITVLPDRVFSGCSGLQALSLPAVTTLGDRSLALGKTHYDLTAELPYDRITSIGTDAFAGFPIADGYRTVSFAALTRVSYRAFAGVLAGGLAFPNATSVSTDAFADAAVGVLTLDAAQTLSSHAIAGCDMVVLPADCTLPVDAIKEETAVANASDPPIWLRHSTATCTAQQYGYAVFSILAGGMACQYQWYAEGADGTWSAIAGETAQSFYPSTRSVGTFSYVCIATNAAGDSEPCRFTLTVTACAPNPWAEDTPLYITDCALHTEVFVPAQSGLYTFQAIGDTRLIGSLTDAQQHLLAEFPLRAQSLTVSLEAGTTYVLHVRPLWLGATQLEVTQSAARTISLRDCHIDYQTTYEQSAGEAFTPHVTLIAPNHTQLRNGTDYVFHSLFEHEHGTLYLFGIGAYDGYVSLPILCYEVVEADVPYPVSLAGAKDAQTYVFIPKESGTYYYYATYQAEYQAEYQTYLDTGTTGKHQHYAVRAAAEIYDSDEQLIASNAYNAYTGSRFNGKVELLAGQRYYVVCTSKSAAKYNLVISPVLHDMRKIHVEAEYYTIYDGTAYTPSVNVTLGETTLTEGVDFVVNHAQNDVPGNAMLEVTGIGLYAGAVTKTYKIVYTGWNAGQETIALGETHMLPLNEHRMAAFWFDADSGIEGVKKAAYFIQTAHIGAIRCSIYRYNALAHSYSLSLVTDGKNAFYLENGRYCLVFYTIYPEVQLASAVRVTRPYNLDEAEIVAQDAVYTGDNLVPDLTVTVHGETLTCGVEYQLSFPENHAMFGEQLFQVVPQSAALAYGSKLGTFQIVVSLPTDAPILTTGEHTAQVTLADRLAIYRLCPTEDTQYLLAGTDVMDTVLRVFDAETNLIADCYGTGTQCLEFEAQAGKTYYIMVKFNGFYREGTLHFSLQNNFHTLDACEKVITPVYWTGEEVPPEIAFYDGDKCLTEGIDYQLRYCANAVNLGTATANFIGMGEYYGTCDISYSIVAPNVLQTEAFQSFPIRLNTNYYGAEDTACDYLIYRYTSGLATNLQLSLFNIFCRLTVQLYNEEGTFLTSLEVKPSGELDFSLGAGETIYLLLSATDINSWNRSFTLCIEDASDLVFQQVIDSENGVTYRICKSLGYAEVLSLDAKAGRAVLKSTVSGYPVVFLPEAAFCDLPSPYTVYGYDGCKAAEYAERYTFAYINRNADAYGTGDLNGDGRCSISDSVLLYYLIAEADSIPISDVQWEMADCNADGAVTLADLLLFLEKLANQRGNA